MKLTGTFNGVSFRVIAGFLLALNTSRAVELPSALATDATDWINVLPAKNLSGWTRVAIPATNALGQPQWHLDDSQQRLICVGNGGHEMLRFDRRLTNCIFHVEFRFMALSLDHPHYNSGIYIRNSADGSIWHQCQLAADGGYLFGNTPVKGVPETFLAPAETRCWKSATEWNTVELTAQGGTLSVWFNGAALSRLEHCEMPSGYVALEAEGYAIEFRNLKLKARP